MSDLHSAGLFPRQARLRGKDCLFLEPISVDPKLKGPASRIVVRQDDTQLVCEHFAYNGYSLSKWKVKVSEVLEFDWKELFEKLIQLVPCTGLSQKAEDLSFKLEVILIEKFESDIVIRSRDCDYVHDRKNSNFCDNCATLLYKDQPKEPASKKKRKKNIALGVESKKAFKCRPCDLSFATSQELRTVGYSAFQVIVHSLVLSFSSLIFHLNIVTEVTLRFYTEKNSLTIPVNNQGRD